ncbi:ATP-binding protein [Streptomyces alkaliphilus]|uniref:histidine kinase n=1 Tax=Streptomyces alkaliphilus TaxID=1472722 RepID=A0A7W3Y0M1_9ACTN|nr:ATP-binding protein [Streptomyces alkaliphilus]MBB0243598.1 ATP-binding protein [Streptomyces alkaliphilus]
MSTLGQNIVPWTLALLFFCAAVAGGWGWRLSRERRRPLEREVRRQRETLRVRDEELRHLLHHRAPARIAATSDGSGGTDPGPLHPKVADTGFGEALDGVLRLFDDAARQAEENTQGLLLAVARKLQGLANTQQVKLTEMTRRHDDPDFLQDLMDIDHTTAQILRRAVGIAVVCQAWPGRQHNATPVYDVVRGAVGRILDYKRIHIARVEDNRAVDGRAVEGLVVALAELLENATRYSSPATMVQVHLQLTYNGLAIVIEDAGVGLNAADRERVARLLNQSDFSIAHLGSPPQFGLVACGALARRYGFGVSVDSGSAFGGVRAVVNVPSALLTEAPLTPPPPGSPGTPAAPVPADTGAGARPVRDTTAGGLPRRRRTRSDAPPGHRDEAGQQTLPTPDQAAASLDAFVRGSRSAAAAGPPHEEGSTES